MRYLRVQYAIERKDNPTDRERELSGYGKAVGTVSTAKSRPDQWTASEKLLKCLSDLERLGGTCDENSVVVNAHDGGRFRRSLR